MSLLNPLSNAFGLDIGDRTFKLVQVERRASGPRPYRISAWNTVDVPEGVMQDGDIKDAKAAAALVRKLVSGAKGRVRGGAVIACLPEAKTFIKVIEVPTDATRAETAQAVAAEIERTVPLPADEIYSDWSVIAPPAKKAPPAPAVAAAPPAADGAAPAEPAEPAAVQPPPPPEEPSRPPVRVLMGAAPKKLVDDCTSMLESAGLAAISLEIEAAAISRAIVPADAYTDEAVGILDIGATRSSLVIYDSGALMMSISIPISGIAITKQISDSLGVGMDDAEKLKRECGLDANRCEDKMWNILLPQIDDITEKIRNALRFYRIGFPGGKKVERVYLCGGGAQFREIDSVLSRKLALKVLRGNALVNVSDRLPRGFAAGDEALTYATAIGLAIHAADENARHRNSLA